MLTAPAAHAIDRSACKQYGGSTGCWMSAIGNWNYDDTRGRLVRASMGGCTVARYRVNPLGQRVRKQTWPVSPCPLALPADPAERDTVYTYDLQGGFFAETHSFAAYKRAFVYLYDMPVAMLFATDD